MRAGRSRNTRPPARSPPRRARSAHTIGAQAIVAFTASGGTALRVARERPEGPVLGLTRNHETARRLAVVWGVHAVVVPEVHTMSEAVTRATRVALAEGFAGARGGGRGRRRRAVRPPGTTNALRVSTVR